MRVRIGIAQDIIEDENIIGNVLDKIEITIQNESSKVYMKKKALTLSVGAFFCGLCSQGLFTINIPGFRTNNYWLKVSNNP